MKQFYLLYLLFYLNTVTCNGWADVGDGNPARRKHGHVKKNGRFRRSRDQDMKSFDRNSVQQFDLASFIQNEPKEIDDPYEVTIKKRHSLDKEDYNSELASDDFYKPRGNYPSMGPDILQLIDSGPRSRTVQPKHMGHFPKYNSYGDDDFTSVGRSKVRDTNKAEDNRKPKKGFLRKMRFPFFSRDPHARSNGAENKKRKLFCLNCGKKNAAEGTNFLNSSNLDKESKLHVDNNRSFQRSARDSTKTNNADTSNEDSSSFENVEDTYLSLKKLNTPQEDMSRYQYLGENYGNKETTEDSNEMNNQKTKSLIFHKRCNNPFNNNIFYNVVNESSREEENFNEKDDNTVIEVKRSFIENLCHNCKKRYLESLNENDESRADTNIIHNSRQFFEKMFSLDAGSDRNKTVQFSNRREKREDDREKVSESERQLKELELVEKRVESVIAPTVKTLSSK